MIFNSILKNTHQFRIEAERGVDHGSVLLPGELLLLHFQLSVGEGVIVQVHEGPEPLVGVGAEEDGLGGGEGATGEVL